MKAALFAESGRIKIIKVTDGRGVDVAIKPLGVQSTLESCFRVPKLGETRGTVS